MQCSYGSIWRKWDFHVHTPYSILNNNYGFNPFELTESDLETEFDEYVKKLFTLAVENNVAAIGITDYFMLEGYKRIKEKYLSSPYIKRYSKSKWYSNSDLRYFRGGTSCFQASPKQICRYST